MSFALSWKRLPAFSLTCRLVPVHYRKHECNLLKVICKIHTCTLNFVKIPVISLSDISILFQKVHLAFLSLGVGI